jgi:multicomponent Na+:H+ antiporter subunit G
MIIGILNVLTALAILFGLFFMFVGALGIWRLPDFYNRTHAGSKCVTLGISGLLVATVLHFGALSASSQSGEQSWEFVVAGTKAILVIIFSYAATPVGSHMLARAAHLDGAEKDGRTLGDDLEVDRVKSPPV